MNSMSISHSPWLSLRADVMRRAGTFSWTACMKLLTFSRTFRPIATMRLCQAADQSKGVPRLFLPLFKIAHRMATASACVDLPWSTNIGAGLSIAHGWGMVVSPQAVIGKNVTLYHGVTLGQRDRISPDGRRSIAFPTIEDEVWVGPHAIIVGGVTIGHGSRVAGGAVVTQDVAPHSIIGGNPAVVMKRNCVPDILNPAPV